ncbi:hypothetical protein [Mycobacterium sp. NPDC050041]
MKRQLMRLRSYVEMVSDVKAISEALDKRRITASEASESISRL